MSVLPSQRLKDRPPKAATYGFRHFLLTAVPESVVASVVVDSSGAGHSLQRIEGKKLGQVAQLVEQRTENPCVGGSIPPLTTSAASRRLSPSVFIGNILRQSASSFPGGPIRRFSPLPVRSCRSTGPVFSVPLGIRLFVRPRSPL